MLKKSNINYFNIWDLFFTYVIHLLFRNYYKFRPLLQTFCFFTYPLSWVILWKLPNYNYICIYLYLALGDLPCYPSYGVQNSYRWISPLILHDQCTDVEHCFLESFHWYQQYILLQHREELPVSFLVPHWILTFDGLLWFWRILYISIDTSLFLLPFSKLCDLESYFSVNLLEKISLNYIL